MAAPITKRPSACPTLTRATPAETADELEAVFSAAKGSELSTMTLPPVSLVLKAFVVDDIEGSEAADQEACQELVPALKGIARLGGGEV